MFRYSNVVVSNSLNKFVIRFLFRVCLIQDKAGICIFFFLTKTHIFLYLLFYSLACLRQ